MAVAFEEPESFKTKEECKLGALDVILQCDQYPDLYSVFAHMVRINHYPPRGDNKEVWDNIDLTGCCSISSRPWSRRTCIPNTTNSFS